MTSKQPVSLWRFGMEKRARAAAKLFRADGHEVQVKGKDVLWFGVAPAGEPAEAYAKYHKLVGVTIEPKGWNA